MKKLYTLLLLVFCFTGKMSAHSVLLSVDSLNQGKQVVTISKCDTLFVIELANTSLYFMNDTLANGSANFSHQVTPDSHIFNGPLQDTFIFTHVTNFQNLYVSDNNGKLYFAISFAECGCRTAIQISSIGLNFTFKPVHIGIPTDSTIYLWTINGDTLASDSLHQSTFTFDTSGTYQICLHVVDTVSACSFDTCKTFNINASPYVPLLDSINIWHMYMSYCFVKEAPDYSPRSNNCYYGNDWLYPPVYYTNGDTAIDSVNYKFVYYGTINNLQNCFYGLLRENTITRKVYFLDLQNDIETLLYDFSLNVGDTFPVHFFFGENFFIDGNYRLDSIGTVDVNATNRRAFYLKCPNSYRSLVWIEGIGNIGHPFYPYSTNMFGCSFFNGCSGWGFPYNYSSFVTCFEHHDKVYFDSCAYSQALINLCIHKVDSCNYYNVCGTIEEISSLASFVISPNPVTDNVLIELDVKQSNNFSLVIQSLDGKRVMAETNLGWLQEGKHNKSIRVSNLSAGIYLVGCKTNEGTVYRKLVVQR